MHVGFSGEQGCVEAQAALLADFLTGCQLKTHWFQREKIQAHSTGFQLLAVLSVSAGIAGPFLAGTFVGHYLKLVETEGV